MDPQIVIITANGTDIKLLNRLLITIRNWDGTGEEEYVARVFRPLKELDSIQGLQEAIDKLPLQEVPENEFVGMSFDKIEKLMLAKCRPKNFTGLFALLDDQGVQEHTIIIAESETDSETKECRSFNKVRVPWDWASGMLNNLSIANMGFDQFCDQKRGPDENGWWKFTLYEVMELKLSPKRDAILKELEILDLA